MNRPSTSQMWLFTVCGIVGGFALAMLIRLGSAPAQAAGLELVNTATGSYSTADMPLVPTPGSPPPVNLPTPDASGAIRASGGPTATTTSSDLPANIAPLPHSAPAAQLARRTFTYQGVLRQAGQPLNGACDFQFGLWDDATAGVQLGVTQTVTSTVANGQFTVMLNGADQFGGAAFDGRAVWMAIGVRCPGGAGSYTPLTPRQALTAAPLAAGLVPHNTLHADDTFSGNSAMNIEAPVGVASNPMGLQVTAANHSIWIGIFSSVGIWTDSGSGIGLWATTDNGTAIQANASGGMAGRFYGDVDVTGRLTSRSHVVQVINQVGPLPITSGSFSTNGGTLMLFYSGSGYRNTASAIMTGMIVSLDGNTVDQTGIYANQSLVHQAFVAKQWVLTGIPAGSHTITLTAMPDTLTDQNDIFTVTVMEMPY